MSNYDPDPAALPVGTEFVRQLSQRDLSLQIPINYVSHVGVSLTPACFARQVYEDGPATKCFSNLLAVGFDRFEIDVYWDTSRSLWSLCPVELGDVTAGSDKMTPLEDEAVGVGRRARLSNPDEDLIPRHPVPQTKTLSLPSTANQATSSTSTSTITTTSTVTAVTRTGSASAAPSASNGTLIAIGPYSCTTTINLSLFTNVLSGHLDSTQNNLNATVKYFILNMHTAAPASDPTGNGSTPTSVITGQGLLSSVLSSQVSQYLYTPNDLASERADLNSSSSWFGGQQRFQPDPLYFDVVNPGRGSSTPNGWPAESYIEMDYAKRLLAGYGTVSSSLQSYNFSGDASTIFARGYLQRNISATFNSMGQVESDCFYRPGVFSIEDVNNSWAATSISNLPNVNVFSLEQVLAADGNLANCGLTPILERTLEGTTADEDFSPYNDFVQSAVWSWARGQPQNGSTHGQQNYRCAALSSDSGQWQSENCGQTHYSACRGINSTYQWTISSSATTYGDANYSCPDNTEFFVPRTALENTYLVNEWRSTAKANDIDDSLLWVNFNDIDVSACWVIGQNATCPYLRGRSPERQVIVPVVAAVIVFVLAALTIFVKCAANRQQSKRRRRRGDDWGDYEGVPS